MSKLSALFDYQKFAPNELMSQLIAETESRYGGKSELSDDELEFVQAAGAPEITGALKKEKDLFLD